MEKEKMKVMLDEMAEAVKTLSKYSYCISELNLRANSIQLYDAVHRFAQIMGLELQEWDTENGKYKYIAFQYKGVTFFELKKHREGEE